ncbi:hypothetical protein Tco_0393117, partial [Tanacetum coccineum]
MLISVTHLVPFFYFRIVESALDLPPEVASNPRNYCYFSVHNTPYNSDDEEHDNAVTLISKLDLSNPLHLHPNDSTTLAIVSIKFKETFDRVDGSITFNLHHKINSLTQNGSSVAEYFNKLSTLWKQFEALIKLPRCTCHAVEDFKKHSQLMKLMQLLMGLDDSYMKIRSNILSRDPLPDAKGAYALISSEESYRAVVTSSGAGPSQRPNNFSRPNIMGIEGLLVVPFWIIVSHPNGTEALITKVGNLKLTNFLTLYDVLVVPEYSVTLVSVHKVARDSKFIVGFDESKCFLMSQNLMDMKLMGIGKQFNGLYYFDNIEGNMLRHSSLSNSSKLNWHNRLGHPSDQSDGSNSPNPGSLTIDLFKDDLGHPQGFNRSASKDEMAATSDPNTALSENDVPNSLNTKHVKNVDNQLLR